MAKKKAAPKKKKTAKKAAPKKKTRSEKKITKLEIKHILADYHKAKKQPSIITIPKLKFIEVTGGGVPGGEFFAEQLGSLFPVAYTIKFAAKAGGNDFKVAPFEGEYDFNGEFGDTTNLTWKLRIWMPDFIKAADLKAALKQLKEKKKEILHPPKLVTLKKTKYVQALHVGPYKTEPKTVALMEQFAKTESLKLAAGHTEVYLSDPRRVAEEKLKTILRHALK